ncbi:hypothetical protein PHYBOEH_011936 [Phytophthora boehmeriae]|uniref:FYVE-type domain-containing protein n=1 Tax=Phytophthora boehmeriae TaxID=109152 RepID=A0A8T1WVS6_9STRA|nr:hypothetical protein PHYBOEH_011936 [Phytophthora boehmeriae]
MERSDSSDQHTPSLFRRLQGKKSASKASTESLGASQPPPRHSHRRILSRDRRRPTVIFYSNNCNSATCLLKRGDSSVTDGELSEDDGGQSEDRFDLVDNKMPDFAASVGPRDTLSRSKGPSGGLMRMSVTWGRASERLETSVDARRDSRRAARQSAKYDVAWRQDDESECCQVCYAMFTKLSRRRHHCRVCGDLVCGACSQDQVALTDKFGAPRRACVACCSLLQAMARAGDKRVKIVEGDATSTTTQSKKHGRRDAATSVPSEECQSPASATMPAPAATPRFRDRMMEVHRVMAAGKLSRRRGSADKKMFVISSRWLRSWLAFTSSASNSNHSMEYGFDTETAAKSPTAKDDELASMGRAPGPIDNLSLLVLSRGKLVQRPGLVRDHAIAGDAAASSGEDADFQLLSPEVWEVFQRLYGGSPAIHVNVAGTDPTVWIVDVAGLLGTTASSRVQVSAAVERALTVRHQDEDDVESVRGPRSNSNQATTPTFAMSSSSDMGASYTPVGGRSYFKQQPKSPAWTASTSSSSSSLSEDKERVRSPTGNGRMQLEDLETDVASLTMATEDTVGEDDMRATTSVRSPTAALAASAFAVAMKQARLNAQKAIDDRSSRVITA